MKNKDIGSKYIKEKGFDKQVGITKFPDVKVVSIDCRQLSNRATLWGEIARQLDMTEKMVEYDTDRIPPSVDLLTEMFEKPVLLLIDELPYHLFNANAINVGNKTFTALTINFLQNMMAALAGTKKSQMLLTLTGDQSLYREELEEIQNIPAVEKSKLINSFRESASRHAHFVVPVEKSDVYDIIRTRLISDIFDQRSSNDVIDSFYEYYNRWFLSPDPLYKEKMKKSYPFHPDLIDILYGRLSTMPEFNKTRGVLKILSLMLRFIFENKPDDAFFIMTYHIPLEEFDVKSQLTDAFGKENYKQVIETDILGKAKLLDY